MKKAINPSPELYKEAEAYAAAVSEKVVIRTYISGNSSDDARETTDDEKKVLFALINGALHGILYQHGAAAQSVADAAEFMLMNLIPDANTYDSVYLPIWHWCKEHSIPWVYPES